MSTPPVERSGEFVTQLFRVQPQLYAYLRTQISSRSDAEDVFQNVTLVLWEKFGEFEPGTDFLAWAFQIARFKVLQYYREDARRRIVFSEEFLEVVATKSQSLAAKVSDMRQALADCMQKLRPMDRDVIERCYLSGATAPSVAADLGRPLEAIKSVLKRSRRRLFECIQRTLAQEHR